VHIVQEIVIVIVQEVDAVKELSPHDGKLQDCTLWKADRDVANCGLTLCWLAALPAHTPVFKYSYL